MVAAARIAVLRSVSKFMIDGKAYRGIAFVERGQEPISYSSMLERIYSVPRAMISKEAAQFLLAHSDVVAPALGKSYAVFPEWEGSAGSGDIACISVLGHRNERQCRHGWKWRGLPWGPDAIVICAE